MLVESLSDKSVSKTSLELGLVFVGSLIYFDMIIMFAKHSLLFETCLCLGLPFLIHVCNTLMGKKINYRVAQLIVIESLFMLFVIAGKISINYAYLNLNFMLGYGFRTLFLIQFSFFMMYQYKVKSYLGMVRTGMFLLLLIPWFSQASLGSNMDATGRFFFSGVQAPDYIIVYYCFWVIGIPLVDSKTLPNFLTAALHISSVIMALISQEFFHARLLTASHLFVLDYLLSYSTPHEKQFGVLNQRQFIVYETKIKPIIDHLTFYACSIVLLVYLGSFASKYLR